VQLAECIEELVPQSEAGGKIRPDFPLVLHIAEVFDLPHLLRGQFAGTGQRLQPVILEIGETGEAGRAIGKVEIVHDQLHAPDLHARLERVGAVQTGPLIHQRLRNADGDAPVAARNGRKVRDADGGFRP